MHSAILPVVCSAGLTGAGELAVAMGLQLLPKLGAGGRRIAEASCRAPLLDVWVAALTWVPWVVTPWFGRPALIGAILGQAVALVAWCAIQEAIYRPKGPRIVTFLNRIVGAWQNHFALWYTLIGLPCFWMIRIFEIAAYWPLVLVLGFPKYKQAEWVNVSRQKFSGLVGHDLIWCLYCDWMTGVYSLGAEMLRNVESFWCPIRFYDGKKCDHCKLDFPDLNGGWVTAEGNLADVVGVMEQAYGAGRREWFGHPARLTVRGKPTEIASPATPISD